MKYLGKNIQLPLNKSKKKLDGNRYVLDEKITIFFRRCIFVSESFIDIVAMICYTAYKINKLLHGCLVCTIFYLLEVNKVVRTRLQTMKQICIIFQMVVDVCNIGVRVGYFSVASFLVMSASQLTCQIETLTLSRVCISLLIGNCNICRVHLRQYG